MVASMRALRVALLIAVFGAGAFAIYLYAGPNAAPLPFIKSNCVVGLQGAAVSVAVDGPSANAQCEAMSHETTNGGSWYVYDSDTEPGGAVICQFDIRGNRWTVRDQGIANMYGSGVCQNLQQMAAGVPEQPEGTDEPEFTLEPSADVGCVVDETHDCAVDGPPVAYDESCTLALVNHDARVYVAGNTGLCEAIRGQIAGVGEFERVESDDATGNRLICSGVLINGTLEVWDSGGAIYGTDVCQRYGFSTQ